MASKGKKKTTMAKLQRESRLREKRQDKQARRAARKVEPAQIEHAAYAAEVDLPSDDAMNHYAACPCGWNSEFLPTRDDAEAYAVHHQLEAAA